MELMKYLRDDKWTQTTPSSVKGMKFYTIVRSEMVTANNQTTTYRYAVKQVTSAGGEGRLAMVTLSGVKSQTDPLRNIRNAELSFGEDNELTAINVDGDCVVQLNSITSMSATG